MGFTGLKKRYIFSSKMRTWETNVMRCEIEFNKLNDQTDYSVRVEPIAYIGKLLLGILCILLSFNWLFVIAFNMINYYILRHITDTFNEAADNPTGDIVNIVLNWCMDRK